MNLTPEQQERGRRNFMRVLAGTPALAALGAAAAVKGPVRGGPVRLGFVGTGGEGRVLLEQTDPRYGEVVALCDINPSQLGKSDESLVKTGRQPVKHYTDWKEMIQKERLEGVVVATPLFTHADITTGCLEAGLHVLCEKMMAWDDASCRRMTEAASRAGRVLEIGHQRYYNPIYQASYDGIVKAGLLGEVYHARLVWHRNGNWRRKADLPSPDTPAPWGYPTFDHLINWRLYKQYSRGHMAPARRAPPPRAAPKTRPAPARAWARRRAAATAWPRTDTRSTGSAAPSAPERRSSAGRSAPSPRPGRASPASTRSRRRRGSASRPRGGPTWPSEAALSCASGRSRSTSTRRCAARSCGASSPPASGW